MPAAEILAKRGDLTRVEFDKRVRLFTFCLAGILHGVYTTHELSPSDADASLEIALALWGLAPDEAKAITSRSLDI